MSTRSLTFTRSSTSLLPPHTSCPLPQLLLDLAEAAKLRQKIDAMFAGEAINITEDRAALHVATRARRDQVGGAGLLLGYKVDGAATGLSGGWGC